MSEGGLRPGSELGRRGPGVAAVAAVSAPGAEEGSALQGGIMVRGKPRGCQGRRGAGSVCEGGA